MTVPPTTLNKLYALPLLFLSIFSPRVYAISAPIKPIVSVLAPNPATGQIQPLKGTLTPSQTREYVIEQAKQVGTPVIKATWILDHESQDGQNLVGDDGDGLGYWMIDHVYNSVSSTCAMDLPCSTAWSLPRIKTNPDMWSTWACRYAWYSEATSTLGPAPAGYVEPKYCRPVMK